MADNRSFSVGRVLGRTFTIWGSNIVTLTILSAIIYSPVLLHAALAFPRPGEDATRFVQVQNVGQFVLSLMATAAVIHGVFQQLRGQPIKIGACLRVCLGRFFPVLGVALLIVLIIVVCALPIVFAFSATGLAFLAVAAAMVVFILLYCMFWVAVPAAVVEKPGVGASLTRSQALTKGNRFAIFLVLLVIGLILFAVNMLVLRAMGDATVAYWVGLFVLVVVGAINGVAAAVGYHDLRVAKEGVGIEELVAVFA